MYDGKELEDEVAGGSEGDDEDFFNEADEVNDNDGVASDNDQGLHDLNNPFSEARYPTGEDISNTERPTIPNDNSGAVSSNI